MEFIRVLLVQVDGILEGRLVMPIFLLPKILSLVVWVPVEGLVTMTFHQVVPVVVTADMDRSGQTVELMTIFMETIISLIWLEDQEVLGLVDVMQMVGAGVELFPF